jgi:hypothetical protein
MVPPKSNISRAHHLECDPVGACLRLARSTNCSTGTAANWTALSRATCASCVGRYGVIPAPGPPAGFLCTVPTLFHAMICSLLFILMVLEPSSAFLIDSPTIQHGIIASKFPMQTRGVDDSRSTFVAKMRYSRHRCRLRFSTKTATRKSPVVASMSSDTLADSDLIERMVLDDSGSAVFSAVSVAAFSGRTLKISGESLRDRIKNFPDYDEITSDREKDNGSLDFYFSVLF